MNFLTRPLLHRALALTLLAAPLSASAQGSALTAAVAGAPFALLFAVFILLSLLLTRLWMGIVNVSMLEEESLASIERRQPYLPTLWVIVCAIFLTAALLALSVKTIGGIEPFDGPNGWKWGTVIFFLIGSASAYCQWRWPWKSNPYLFAVIFGTIITFVLIGFKQALFSGAEQNPFLLALGLVCTIMAWRFLFGPWSATVKVTMLGTFLLWVGMHLVFREAPPDRMAYLFSIFIALVPAVIWCWLFLEYHKQRKSLVILMFFAGMVSTAPILFYDAMVRNGVELEFFLFRIVPQSFTTASNAFVNDQAIGTGVQAVVLATLISFLLVGLIEEVSKFWVLKKSVRRECTSIDDVMQLGIIVAIGFAFAENVLNPTYFIAFVREYIMEPEVPQWSAFIGNVLGRSILTNMVHIVSTGVLAYYYGLALFARTYLEDAHRSGRHFMVPRFLHLFLRLPEKEIFKREMIITGFVLSIGLHGMFNFLVTLPDIMPNQPRTIGALLNMPASSPLHYIAILVIPSVVYVVGGLWLLSVLFYKKENMKERGHLVETEAFVRSDYWNKPLFY